MVRVSEHKGGLTKSANYYFVIDGNKLFHISKYATSIQDKRFNVVYEVDLSKLSGKISLRFSSATPEWIVLPGSIQPKIYPYLSDQRG